LFITVVNEALSLALLNSPGECGADIVVIEAQSFGNYISYGGPLLGVIAAKNEFLRKMPGRLVGKTKDSNGADCFVLTLQTREQHIRREKATSNICSNEGLLALRAVIYLSLLGPKLKDLAELNHSNAVYLKNELTKIEISPVFDNVFFNEFVIKIPNSKKFIAHMMSKNINAGIEIENHFPQQENFKEDFKEDFKDCVLVCVTETLQKADMDLFISELKNFKDGQSK
jgi:glycine dehydrogenase subunit 1